MADGRRLGPRDGSGIFGLQGCPMFKDPIESKNLIRTAYMQTVIAHVLCRGSWVTARTQTVPIEFLLVCVVDVPGLSDVLFVGRGSNFDSTSVMSET